MELKRVKIRIEYTFVGLLIVPYGIETQITTMHTRLIVLLIVPYGIETKKSRLVYHRFRFF